MHWVALIILTGTVTLGSLAPRVIGQVGTWRTFTNTNYIRDIGTEGDTLWLATTGGVVTFDVQSGSFVETYTNVDGLAHVAVTSVTIDRKGHMWFGTDGGGLSKWKRSTDTWRTYTEFDGVALRVKTLWQDGATFWVGTDEGIAFFRWGWDWDERDSTYVWKENYDSRNGLPNDFVTSFATDSSTVWVGTKGGVSSALKMSNLKDPLSWRSYTTDDGLPSVDVLSLAVADARIWVGTDRGVAFFDGQSWIEDGLSRYRIHSLRVLADTLWAGTSGGIFKLKDYGWMAVAHETLPFHDVSAVARTRNGVLVCGGTGTGLAVFDGTVWTHFLTEGPWQNNCMRVMIDRNGFVWCSMRGEGFVGKVSRYFAGHWADFDEDDGLETGERIVSMMEDDEGRKWFGSWGDGASRLDDRGTLDKSDDEWMVFNAQNSGLHGIPEDPAFEVITAIKEDGWGNIWFANYLFGVVVYSPQDDLWETFTPTDGLVDQLVSSLALESEGVVWIGAEQNGASRLNTAGTPFFKGDDAWQTLNADSGLTNSAINSIVAGKGGILWFGTNQGLFWYDGKNFHRNIEIQNTGVLCLGQDSRFNLWAGTSDQGIFVLNRQGTLRTQYNTANSGLVDNAVNDIAFNAETGEVWVATPAGLSRYESGIVKPKGETETVNFYPNPFVPSEGHEVVTFYQLPDEPLVRIYTLFGELVAELLPPANAPDLIFWNGENRSGERVGSGVYIVVLVAPGVRPRMGKLAVIR
ncbi:MAG: two-component regulator propeller domain-containing protein [bacterium]